MVLHNQTIKDAIDYHVPLAGESVHAVAEFLTPKIQDEMLELWLEHNGFTKDGCVKPEFIEKDYFHVLEEYSYRTGYSQMVYITHKGIQALAATFKSDNLSEEQYRKILEREEIHVPTEKTIIIEGVIWVDKNCPILLGHVYPTYDGCLTLIDSAKLIVSETHGNIEDFLRFLWEKEITDKYCYPSQEALKSGLLKRAVQILKWKRNSGEVAEEHYPLTLVTPEGLDTLKKIFQQNSNS